MQSKIGGIFRMLKCLIYFTTVNVTAKFLICKWGVESNGKVSKEIFRKKLT
ncbi:MAG: hypothetical protein RIQ89_773 [Bacteroidota bacterium]|jgi:hypothetical protein